MDCGDPASSQTNDKEKGLEKIEKLSSKGKSAAGADSDSDQEHHHSGSSPPNLFCTLPSTKSLLPSQPIPLAFLHRIVAENRIKNGLHLDEFRYLQDKNRGGTGWNGAVTHGEPSEQTATSGIGSSIGSGVENGSLSAASDGKMRSDSSEGDSTLLATTPADHHGSFSSSASSESSHNIAAQSVSARVNQVLLPPPETELEAPWFSQLASLPHLRSAGIPPVAPHSSSSLPKTHQGKEKLNGFGAFNLNADGRPNTSSGSGITRHNSPTNQYSSTSLSVHSSPGGGNQIRPKSANDTHGASDQLASLGAVTEPLDSQQDQSQTLEHQHSTIPIPKPISISQALNLSPEENLDEPLLPPDNFSMVNTWVYRSSFPKKKHFPFLKSLGLRSVLTLILEEYPEQNTKFLDEQGIKFFQYGIPGNKEPFVQIPEDKITAALVTILDRRNHPMLIHCNKGKHRTGCLIGCLRKLQHWSLTTIFDEYRRFSFPKSRSMDQEFIELYKENEVWKSIAAGDERVWLPNWSVISSQLAALPPQISSGPNKQLLLSSKHREDDLRYSQTVRGM